MTKKFTPTIADKLNAINKDMIAAREQKKKELIEKHVPETLKGVLTPEEVNRSANMGMFVGMLALLVFLFCIVWWFFK